MYWLHLTEKQKKQAAGIREPVDIPDPFADQRESLHWTAMMITGDAELAKQCVIDATRLALTGSSAYRDWLVLWAHLATARAALSMVRDSIQEPAKRHSDGDCQNSSQDPLTVAESQILQDLPIDVVLQQLDVLARAVLLIRGCHGASFEDCVSLLDVPLTAAVGAYCRAVQWFKAYAESRNGSRDDQPQPHLFSFLKPRWSFGA